MVRIDAATHITAMTHFKNSNNFSLMNLIRCPVAFLLSIRHIKIPISVITKMPCPKPTTSVRFMCNLFAKPFMNRTFFHISNLIILFLLSSCSQQFHCRKCLSGGNTITDIVTVYDTLYLPGVRVDTVVQYDLSTDTLVVTDTKTNVVIKYRDLPGPTVYLAAQCPPDSIYVEKKVLVPVEVNNGSTRFQVILYCLITGLAVAGLVALLFLLRKR